MSNLFEMPGQAGHDVLNGQAGHDVLNVIPGHHVLNGHTRLDRVSLEFFDGCHAFLDSLLVKGNEVRIACRDAFSKTLVDVLE